jgi:hypothetical protein
MCHGVDWIHLKQDSDKCQALMHTKMNHQRENYLTRWSITNTARKTLFREFT